ncbi:signal peptide peptidase SppA [Halobacterium yunchengense]|uniref:signal peptide peptidase SppA n=1 Tax=Halobacterium yunchengense TaxID=3108497 RepID=UPI0030095192
MDSTGKRVGRRLVVAVGAVAGTAVGWLLFVRVPDDRTVLGVLLTVAAAALAVKVASSVASSAFGAYDTAAVRVTGPIARDGGRSIPANPQQVPAGAVVDQIERADADANVAALVVRLNTPGGEVVPSDDIRRAAADFDGPTVAYATDVCASGGYWIASACDRVVARENSLVGSVGVRGSRLNAADLAAKLGVDYERLVAGEYKDAGTPLRDLDEDERRYLQGIVDDLYDSFVATVADGRDLSEDAVRDTEARVFVGADAVERGLVDEVGTREDVEAYLADELGHDVEVRAFEPPVGLRVRLRRTALGAAYALGAGVASAFGDGDGTAVQFR